jgi:uncharacterized protein (UPF0335 family)/uncharacterized C2H2 Zn-finger protein
MVKHKCKRCEKEFKNRTDFTRHMNRKYLCPIKVIPIINEIKTMYKCLNCNKKYVHGSSLSKHKKMCNNNIEQIDYKKMCNNNIKQIDYKKMYINIIIKIEKIEEENKNIKEDYKKIINKIYKMKKEQNKILKVKNNNNLKHNSISKTDNTNLKHNSISKTDNTNLKHNSISETDDINLEHQPIYKNNNVSYKKKISESKKTDVWNTYIGENVGKSECKSCKIKEITSRNFQVGHIIAEANGGTLDINNLRPICIKCNLSMGISHMHDFMQQNNYGKLE